MICVDLLIFAGGCMLLAGVTALMMNIMFD